jgi:hypothetical protein
MATRTKTEHAAAAQAIRQDLKRAWPSVKFQVTSQGYSMGNSVSIRWTDGPTSAEVGAITGRYQAGHFDGMQDLYEYSNRRDDLPQAKYVSTSRSMSDETRADLLRYVVERYFNPGERDGVDENTRIPNGYDYVQTYVYREFSQRSYCDPAAWMPEEPEDEPETVEPEKDITPTPMWSSLAQPEPARSHEDELDDLIRSRVLDMMQLDAMACVSEVVQ